MTIIEKYNDMFNNDNTFIYAPDFMFPISFTVKDLRRKSEDMIITIGTLYRKETGTAQLYKTEPNLQDLYTIKEIYEIGGEG